MILVPPAPEENFPMYGVKLDVQRITIEWICISLVTGAAWVMTANPQRKRDSITKDCSRRSDSEVERRTVGEQIDLGDCYESACARLARRLGLPLYHEVQVWLKNGTTLRGKLRLNLEDRESSSLGLAIGRDTFRHSDIESCIRKD